jgi:hypothetical protein
MATLHEYFVKDGGKTLCMSQPSEIRSEDGEVLLEITSRLHLDFEANALYVSFYIPQTIKVDCPSRMVLNGLDTVLGRLKDVYVEAGLGGQEKAPSTDLKFTGRVYIYSDDPIRPEDIKYIRERSKELGQSVIFRLEDYAVERSKWEKPLAFISHDSRDKKTIAEPLALELYKHLCPVWYDEFSLKVGDSLRNSIEKGLMESHKCIFLITPNFLANGGWAKREYDSVFTRELVERENVILPVWNEVTVRDVYQYSPILADKVAVNWSDGVEEVARKLMRVINA